MRYKKIKLIVIKVGQRKIIKNITLRKRNIQYFGGHLIFGGT
jgi:hypothetical protein